MKDDVTKNSKRFKKRKTKGGKVTSRDEETRETRGTTKSNHTNDPSWYGNNDALLRDAGSYSFNNPLGNTLRVTEFSNFDPTVTYVNRDNLDFPIPGILALKYIPTYGGSQGGLPGSVNANTPINIAARGLYSAVRADNSGAKNYDPSDLMKYLIAMDSVICYHSFLRRIYGLARVYSSVNRYWPKALIQSMNVDFENIIANLADLRYYINAMAAKINRFCVPANMPIFLRHYFMNAGVYRDDYSDKAQMYLFNPRWLYAYNETVTPSALDPIDVCDATGTGVGNTLTLSDLIAIMNQLMDPLTASEDIGIISGDLFKRYGLDGSFTLTPLDVDYAVVPQFDDVVLSQIQNATVVNVVKTSIIEGTTIGVDDGLLYQTLSATQLGAEVPTLQLGHPLNLFKDMDKITPSDVMEATRLTVHGSLIYNSTDKWFDAIVTECGSELITSFQIWRLGVNNGQPTVMFTKNGQITNSPAVMRALSSFNQHPYIIDATADPLTGTFTINPSNNSYVYDFDNYTIIGGSGLAKLHETALLSLFGVPAMGQYR